MAQLRNYFLCFLFMCLFVHYGTTLDLFEGDIVMTDTVKRIVSGASGYDAKVTGHWPNGIVPYTFDRYFDPARRGLVAKAIADYNQRTCIRFVPRTNERNYVRFIVGSGCYSNVGVEGGHQDISIGNGCTSHGTIIHEMMHAIGFFHEQSRHDRDNYINIHWQNIPKKNQHNFQFYRANEATYHGEPYDFASVMHYDNYAFSNNGRQTITVKNDPTRAIGQRVGFSAIDLRQINKMYKCQGDVVKPPPKPGNCIDTNAHCQEWAKRGECNINAHWMKSNCRLSCGTCTSGCLDSNKDCVYWSSIGECHVNANYMLENCQKSCKQC